MVKGDTNPTYVFTVAYTVYDGDVCDEQLTLDNS